MSTQAQHSRRGFLKLTAVASGGLCLSYALPTQAQQVTTDIEFSELNAFVQIDPDGRVTIYSANAEMGQGIKTALPMIIAEELGVAWDDVTVKQSPIDSQRFGAIGAGGSTTVPRTWNQMRTMGASAREMLISAGALVMEVPPEELRAQDSKIIHTSGRYRTFAQLASIAAEQDVPDPETLRFKNRENYTLIGSPVSGVDNYSIVTGSALFGIDTRVPDMLYASYSKCPAIGGTVKGANIDELKKLPGVVDAFIVRGNGNPRELLDGVAIVGTSTHAVFKAKQSLRATWDETNASKDSWSDMVTQANEMANAGPSEARFTKGDVESQFADPQNTVHSAFFEYPFIAHFTLEPMNCTAHYKAGVDGGQDTLEVWLPHQIPERSHAPLKSIFGLEPEQVTLNQMRLGGSFGRRVYAEFVCEATEISKRMGQPVKLTWTREDDTRHDFYRVGGFQSVKAALNPDGQLVAFDFHHIGMQNDGKPVMGSGVRDTEFPLQNIDNGRVSDDWFEIGTPAGPWRAPFSNVNAFVTQSFLAEMAHLGGRDYAEFLLEILGERRWFEEGNIRSLNTGRAADVINRVVKEANWGKTMPAGKGQGLSFYFCHAAHVAEVAEVTVSADKAIRVDKVTVAVDVGPIINLSGAMNQVEGSIVDGLSAMKGQKITMEGGRIQQSNLHDYPVLRMPDSPVVEIHFVESEFDPTGLGEPALPPLAPAVANAIFAATGERVRKMPLIDEGYT
ncbi:MAG: molybdopterin-dependent oxidoreductase [Pseudomonadaceae bacterium]|nr:molybdopterin-dependent oxidoreductase [Pseudomonadaceae bacterium]